MLVSVIVPVFNVQQYIGECVDSILAQTFHDFELILVDDGSTDGSGNICNEYARKYNNIRVIHKSNGGLSDARNTGIKVARGKYVCFIDGDDYVANDYIEFLYHGMKNNNTKISACGFCRVYENGKKSLINRTGIRRIFEGEDAQKYLCAIGYYNVSACNKLFDITLFNDVIFPVGKNSEDCFVMYKLIEMSGAIYYDSKVKYFYRQRIGSITKSNNINKFTIESNENVYKYYLSKGWKKAIPYAAQALVFAYIGIYNQYLKGSTIVNKKDAMALRKKVLSLQSNITYNDLSKSRKIQVYLFMHSSFFYNMMFKMFEKVRRHRYRV